MILLEYPFKYSSGRSKNKRDAMKKTFVILCATALIFTACNGTNQKEIDRQDSIKEAATADSMLNSAIEADSLIQDTLRVDSIISKPKEQKL